MTEIKNPLKSVDAPFFDRANIKTHNEPLESMDVLHLGGQRADHYYVFYHGPPGPMLPALIDAERDRLRAELKQVKVELEIAQGFHKVAVAERNLEIHRVDRLRRELVESERNRNQEHERVKACNTALGKADATIASLESSLDQARE